VAVHPRASKPRDSRAIRIPPHLVRDDIAVADHEGGDLHEERGQLQPLESQQQFAQFGRRGEEHGGGDARVPLARTFQAPHRPFTLSDRPRTSTRSPSATNGMSTAKATNGDLDQQPLEQEAAGTRAL